MYRWAKLAKIEARCTRVNWRNIGQALFKAISIRIKVRILINAQINLCFFCSQDLVNYNFYFTNSRFRGCDKNKQNYSWPGPENITFTREQEKSSVLYSS